MEDRNNLIHWIQQHKKQLIAAGISVGAVLLIIVGLKNKDAIEAIWASLKREATNAPIQIGDTHAKSVVLNTTDAIQEVLVTTENVRCLPFPVSGHIRNLHEGCHASAEKIAEALANNIILSDRQTWVSQYMKGDVAA